MESLKTARLENKLLSGEPRLILKGDESKSPLSLWNNFYTYSAIFILIAISRKKWIYLSVFSIFGLFGLFLSLVGFYSYHQEVSYNYNTLLLNPLFLLLLYFYWKKKYKWLHYICITNLILLGIYTVFLVNKPNLLLFTPMILTSAIVLIYFYNCSRNKIKRA